MPNPKRPGVYVNENLAASHAATSPSTSVAAFVGPTWKGPTTAQLVRSWTEYTALYGGFPTSGETVYYLPYSVFMYFANGGRECYVTRVVGTGIVTATVTLNDRAGSPLATLRVDAISGGAWGNNLRVDIVDRDASNGRFDLIVKYGGTTDAFVVERWTDVSMAQLDARYVASVINNPDAGSRWIQVTDLNSVTVAPNDTPVVAAGSTLATGADGAAPTAGQMQAAVTAGTSPLDAIPGILTINLPGESTAATLIAADAYCSGRGNCFLIVDPAVGQTPAQVLTFQGTLTQSSYSAIYYPWLRAGDPGSGTPGASRLIPPGGAIAGKFAETDALRGVFKAPAGLNTLLANVLDLERKLTDTDLDNLNAGYVNAIRIMPGIGVPVMGARTCKKTSADRYVPVRRTLNYLKQSIIESNQWAIFEPNDFVLWSTMSNLTTQFLTNFWRTGGLRGRTADQAFYVKCDDELNTPTTIAQGLVLIEVGVAVQYPAEFIVFTLGLYEGGNTAAEAA